MNYQRQNLIKMTSLLRSILGIGFITSITILTELENINRFQNIDNLCRLIGLLPSKYHRGEKI